MENLCLRNTVTTLLKEIEKDIGTATFKMTGF